jgi:VanZ family protein
MVTIGDSARENWLFVGLTALALVVGSLIPSPFSRRPEFKRFGPDKVLHFVGHAGFSVALADALVVEGFDPTKSGVLAVSGSTILGFVIGALQRGVPNRSPERADTVAGLLGSLFGLLFWRSTSR